MNLSEALDAALPEIPKARLARSKPPTVDPDLIIREETMDGEPYVGVLQRDNASFFRFSASQWQMIQLFNGERTFEEISEICRTQYGVEYPVEDLSSFAASMEEQGFWYRTPQEKNIAMNERLMAQRSRRAQRSSKVNLAHISFSAWDPDRYLTRLDHAIGAYIYNQFTVLLAVALFVFETYVFVQHWNVIGPDIPAYYSFTSKSLADFAEFWILLFMIGFVHESAHGLTCKHFGGEVHSMGLMFLYLTPCFYVDVTETWIYATRVQRLWTIIAGIWIELILCGLAMVVWTNTDPGSWLYEISYKLILITGVAVVVLNLNPLLKLDGYYFLTESIGMPELKERSTAFVSEWFQNRILRLQVEITPIPRNRALLYTVYALLSGAYSYFVLFAVIRLAYNLSFKLVAGFAVVPAAVLAFVMFRSRLRSLKELVTRALLGEIKLKFGINRRAYWLAALLLLVIVLPLWRDRLGAYYVVEPANPVTVHAAIAGKVETVYVRGGQHVSAGDPLLRMTSSDAAAMHSEAAAMTGNAHYRAFESQLRGESIGTAAADQLEASRSRALAGEAQDSLVVRAPVNGVVLNRDPDSLFQNTVASGLPLLTLADDGPRLVRVYIPFTALKRVTGASEVLLMPPGSLAVTRMQLGAIDGQAVSLPADLAGHQDYKGLALPTFYSARIPLGKSSAELPLGTAGNARILGERRSLLARAFTSLSEAWHQHVWW